jgi:hypothetical protein
MKRTLKIHESKIGRVDVKQKILPQVEHSVPYAVQVDQ